MILPRDRQKSLGLWLYALYAIAVGLSAGLLTFLVVISAGPFYESREAWEGLGIAWYLYGLPALLVATLASAFVFPRYVASDTFLTRSMVFVTNVLGAALVALGVTLLVIWT